MTFKEALEKKNEIGDSYKKGRVEYKVVIVPKEKKAFADYLDNYLGNKYTDERCKLFTTNNDFEVVGFWDDGASIGSISID